MMKKPLSVSTLILLLIHLIILTSFAETRKQGITNGQKTKTDKTKEEKKISFEFELDLDAYYSSVALIGSLTDEPIPDVGEKGELEIYKDLFLSSYLPRFFLVEASINPMPCLGVAIKKNAKETYEDANVGDDINLIKAVTAGFEEPWALSFFLGDVVSFSKPGAKKEAWNKGFMGYLLSVGDYHIKDNELIRDNWFEVEWKIKGDREYPSQKLNWSFRVGGKFHNNSDITDVLYASIRRSRLDYKASAISIWKNSGIEYTFDVDTRDFRFVRHYLAVDKKWPFKDRKFAISLAIGFIWESDKRYKGSLRDEGIDNYQILIRPNLEF
jgi:hypothetical protein